MDIIAYSIKKPVTVTVGVILVVLFGLIGLRSLPVQLTPDVEIPQITVSTTWVGATPYEMESEVTEIELKVTSEPEALGRSLERKLAPVMVTETFEAPAEST